MLAIPSSLKHDIDGDSNKTVVGENNGKHDSIESDSDIPIYSSSKNDKRSGSDRDCTGLSSNGRIVSTNNKNSFISGNNVEKKVMLESVEKDSAESGKRFRLDETIKSEKKSRTSQENVISTATDNKIENTKMDFISTEDTTAQNEKNKVKELERKKRYLSKTSKWTDFTAWVNTLVCEAETNEDKIRNNIEIRDASSDTTGVRDVVYTPVSDVVYDRIDQIDNKAKMKIRNPHRKYDVIVDGANVGYYKQNFSGAPSHIDYRQVDWMLRQLIRRGMYVCTSTFPLHTYLDSFFLSFFFSFFLSFFKCSLTLISLRFQASPYSSLPPSCTWCSPGG